MIEDEQQLNSPAADNGCIHKWRIESPNGASSLGVCKVCGFQEEFKNSIEYSNWISRGRMGKRRGRPQNKSN